MSDQASTPLSKGIRIPLAELKFTNANLPFETFPKILDISGNESNVSIKSPLTLVFNTTGDATPATGKSPQKIDAIINDATNNNDEPAARLHPIDSTIALPSDQYLFKMNFLPYRDENCAKQLLELLQSWDCAQFYNICMRKYFCFIPLKIILRIHAY